MTNGERMVAAQPGITCLVPNCKNHPWDTTVDNTGWFMNVHGAKFWICAKCYDFLMNNSGEESQLFQNAVDKTKCKAPKATIAKGYTPTKVTDMAE